MKLHQVTIRNGSYDILDADPNFYVFIGSREYCAFDTIISENYRQTFFKYLRHFMIAQEEKAEKIWGEEKFFLRLLDEDEEEYPFVCWFTSGADEERLKLNLVDINDLMEASEQSDEIIGKKDMILSLYNDAFFEYDPVLDELVIYFINKGMQIVFKGSLENLPIFSQRPDFFEDEDVITFVDGLKLGSHEQSLLVPFDFMDLEKEGVSSYIRSGGIYKNGEYVKSCGFVRVSDNNGLMVNKQLELDSLTGVLTKAEITGKAISLIDTHKTKNISLAIIDVDYFKTVNDNFGHMKGDEVLRSVAAIIEKCVGESGTVGRIGGDEFMVIFYNAYDMENMRDLLKSIKNTVAATYPAGIENAPVVSLSIGCASYPKDADNYSELFMLADYALYKAKEKGRDRYIIYDIIKHGGLEVAKNMTRADRIEGRGDLSISDILCSMMDAVYSGQGYPLQKLLDDFVVNFEISRIIIYAGKPYDVTYFAGESIPSAETFATTKDYVNRKDYDELFGNSTAIYINKIKAFEDKHKEIYEKMAVQGIESVMQFRISDKNGTEAIISMEAVKKAVSWNKERYKYYRLFANLLSTYELTRNGE